MADTNDVVTTLLAGYVPAGAVEKADVAELQRLLGAAGDPWSQELPVHLTASALVVHVPTGRLLLRWHNRQRAWLQIGGHGDPGEVDPVQIALREGHEETGLSDLVPLLDARLVHVVMCAVPAKGDSPAHRHGDLRFILATASPDDARPEHAEAALRWVSVDEAEQLTTEDNLLETIRRVAPLLDTASGNVPADRS